MSSLSPSPLLQALRLCGQEAGQHDGQRQPPLRRDGPGAARQRHRQLCAEDDRRAEAMKGGEKKKTLAPFSFTLWLFWFSSFFKKFQRTLLFEFGLSGPFNVCLCLLSFLFSLFFPFLSFVLC